MAKKRKKKQTSVSYATGRLLIGSCLERLKDVETGSVDSIVTDPPYELGFMGKAWDASGVAYQVELWRECLRVLKPGGHLLAFGGTRTYHRMAVAIEDAGFEIRDSIHWVYGSGFPKSLDVSKALEAQAKTGSSSPKAQRKAAMGDDYEPTPLAGTPGYGVTGNFANKDTGSSDMEITTDAAKQWEGWGTALKPAHEPIVLARKPLDGTVAANVLEHGTGALNIDGCRIGDEVRTTSWSGTANYKVSDPKKGTTTISGRWPANIIFDEDAGVELDAQSGVSKSQGGRIGKKEQGTIVIGGAGKYEAGDPGYGDTGGASRFFYCPKPSKSERNAGLHNLEKVTQGVGALRDNGRESKPRQNFHPTVKPVALMRWLVRLITPPGGTVLDPFLGSGTTAVAAILEGFDWLGCEMTEDYLPIIKGRVQWAQRQPRQLPHG